jgi:hypothetical protein
VEQVISLIPGKMQSLLMEKTTFIDRKKLSSSLDKAEFIATNNCYAAHNLAQTTTGCLPSLLLLSSV